MRGHCPVQMVGKMAKRLVHSPYQRRCLLVLFLLRNFRSFGNLQINSLSIISYFIL